MSGAEEAMDEFYEAGGWEGMDDEDMVKILVDRTGYPEDSIRRELGLTEEAEDA